VPTDDDHAGVRPLRRVHSGLRIFSLLAMLTACVCALVIAIEGFGGGQIGVGIAGLLLLAGTASYAWVRYLRVRGDSGHLTEKG
jgi:hypothetical protein